MGKVSYSILKNAYLSLQSENERLKEENYQLQKDCQICENFIDFIPCKPIRDMDYDLQKVISQRDNYYQALQEIMDIADGMHDWWINKTQYTDVYELAEHLLKTELNRIIDKINEVIGGDNG